MPSWQTLFDYQMIRVLPWIVGGVVCAVLLGWSPLGRGVFRWMKRPATDDAAIRELHNELDAVRVELSELQERLDYAERMLATESRERVQLPLQEIEKHLTPV